MMIVSLAVLDQWRLQDMCDDGDDDLAISLGHLCYLTLGSFFMSSSLQEYVWFHGGFSGVRG